MHQKLLTKKKKIVFNVNDYPDDDLPLTTHDTNHQQLETKKKNLNMMFKDLKTSTEIVISTWQWSQIRMKLHWLYRQVTMQAETR